MRDIFHHQEYLMDEVYKIGTDPESRVEAYRTTTLAAVDELMEALHHVPWKPWSKKKMWNRDELHEELVDVFTFFVQLCHLAGLSPDRLERGYFEKAEVNKQRQDSGVYGADRPQIWPSQGQLEALYEVAELGECTTDKVGCLILSPDGVEVYGYNKSVDGVPCNHPAAQGCPGRTIHAEISALAEFVRIGVSAAGCYAFTTSHPCDRCRETLRSAGIVEIWKV